MGNTLSVRDALLSSKIGAPVQVGAAYVRMMNGVEREAWEHSCSDTKDEYGDSYCIRALLVIACCCDETGNLQFMMDDYDALCKLPASVLIPIADKASEVNGLGANRVEGN